MASHTVEVDGAHHARHHDHETRLLLIVLAGGEQIVARGRVEAPVAVLARAVDALEEGGRTNEERGRERDRQGQTRAEEIKHTCNTNT